VSKPSRLEQWKEREAQVIFEKSFTEIEIVIKKEELPLGEEGVIVSELM